MVVTIDVYSYTHALLLNFCLVYVSLQMISFSELTVHCVIQNSFTYISHQSWKPSVPAFGSFSQKSQQYILGFLYFFPLFLCSFNIFWSRKSTFSASRLLPLKFAWQWSLTTSLGFFLSPSGKQPIQRTLRAQNGILHFKAWRFSDISRPEDVCLYIPTTSSS